MFLFISGLFLEVDWKLINWYLLQLSSWLLFFSSIEKSFSGTFWALFGQIDLGHFHITEKGFESITYAGIIIFGVFNVAAVLVALNMLIAILNDSYTRISVSYFFQVTYRPWWRASIIAAQFAALLPNNPYLTKGPGFQQRTVLVDLKCTPYSKMAANKLFFCLHVN